MTKHFIRRTVPKFAIQEQPPMSINDASPADWDRAGRWASSIARDSLDKQVGGTHYKEQGLQPIEACYLRYGYEGVKAALHTKVDKYLQRDKENSLEDLEKAQHCIGLMIDFYKMEHGL